MQRLAVKFAYDGTSFMGSQRQPHGRTVEDEIVRGLKKIKAIDSTNASRFKVASRTDRGVSALGNVFAFDTDFREDELLKALNSVCQYIYFQGIAQVPSDFSPRRAKERSYRYYLIDDEQDIISMKDAAEAFIGKHDFRRFCKPEGKCTVKSIRSITIERVDGFIEIDIRAREFLRNMVRRIVAALDAVGRGDVSEREVRRALDGLDVTFGVAPPENLFLLDVEYDINFKGISDQTVWRIGRREWEKAWLRRKFFDEVMNGYSI